MNKIVISFRHYCLVLPILLVAFVLSGAFFAGQALAGFEMKGGASVPASVPLVAAGVSPTSARPDVLEITNDPAAFGVSMGPYDMVPPPVDVITPLPDSAIDDSAAIDSAAGQKSALVVSHERYIPDHIKQKYALGDEWVSSPAVPEALPVINTVMEPVVPPAVPAVGADMQPSVLTVESSQPPAPLGPVVDGWRARKGEDVRSILKRWTDRAGTQFVWAAQENSVLKSDFSFFGPLNDAVAKLMKDTGVKNLHSQYRPQGMNPVMASPAATEQRVSSSVSSDSIPSFALNASLATENASTTDGTRWFALTGASLDAVLDVWAEDAGAQVIWDGPKQNFAIKQTVSEMGSFEQALSALLGQYDGMAVRPVGTLYTHPDNGQKILVLKTQSDGPF